MLSFRKCETCVVRDVGALGDNPLFSGPGENPLEQARFVNDTDAIVAVSPIRG